MKYSLHLKYLFPSEKTTLSVGTMLLWANNSATFPGPANNSGKHTTNHFNLPTVLKLSDQAESINPDLLQMDIEIGFMNLGER